MKPDRVLIEIFSAEQAEHVARLRALADALPGEASESDRRSALDEALRRAHTLKGAARAVGLERTEFLAHRLETVFARARSGALRFDASGASVAHRVLDAMEDILAALVKAGNEPDTSAAGEALDALLGGPLPGASRPATETPVQEEPPQPAIPAGEQPTDLIRVDAASIDDLIRASSQLFAAIAAQSAGESETGKLSARTAETLTQWGRLRRQCAPYIRRRQDNPDFAPVSECLNYIDEQLRSLAAGARAAAAAEARRNWDLRRRSSDLQRGAVRARMTPAETVFGGFGAMVRDLARQQGKQVEFRSEGLDTQADRAVLQGLKDSVMHLLRNAVTHGVGTPAERERAGKPPSGAVRLRVHSVGDRLNIAVEDDGRGIDAEAVLREAAATGLPVSPQSSEDALNLIFRPGLSTSKQVTNLAGRGMGLSVVQQAVGRLQGETRVTTLKAGGTTFTIAAPLSISTHHVLLLAAGEFTFALPARSVQQLFRVRISELRTIEGREAVVAPDGPVPLVRLDAVLGVAEKASADADAAENGGTIQVAIVLSGDRRAGFVVDRLLDDREAVVKDLGLPESMDGMTAGGIALEDGTVAPVLDPAALLEKVRDAGGAAELRLPPQPAPAASRRILVVDDSITTRSLERSILEAHGYAVQVAVDGVEALERLRKDPADLVITDVMMPRMDGLQLLQEIRNDKKLAEIPVIVVTSLERREDQERGLSLGADAYIVKRKFDQRELLNTVRQIL